MGPGHRCGLFSKGTSDLRIHSTKPLFGVRIMEHYIIQYPIPMLLGWVILNLLHYCFAYFNKRLYMKVVDIDPKYATINNLKSFLIFLVWLGLGIGILSGHSLLIKKITDYDCIYIGALFFLIFGYLLEDIFAVIGYFVLWKRSLKTSYSVKDFTITYFLKFSAYSLLVFLCYLISKNPFLLGGAIGIAFGGIFYLVHWEQYYLKIKHNSKNNTNSCGVVS
jgi:hypothetical protein